MSVLSFRACSLVVVGTALLAAGCNGRTPSTGPGPQPRATPTHDLDLPEGQARPGTAVAILVDTSGSMAQTVKGPDGRETPKHVIARQALDGIVQNSAAWQKKNPDRHLQVGIYHFSSSTAQVLPLGEFNADKARAAVAALPGPNGGTAIGRALEEAYRALYRSGCARKYIVCITDGENTSGPDPGRVARGLFAQTKGAVNLDFVAFDTSARHFAFLGGVNGRVVEAADGAQLEAELNKIYEKRILAEALEEPGK